MAASATPMGARPVGSIISCAFNNQVKHYKIKNAYGTSIFYGDFVKMTSDGVVALDTGTTTLTPIGVFMGCSYTDPNTNQMTFSQYYPASTVAADISAYVLNDPFVEMRMQGDATLAQTALGNNAAVVQTAGSTSIGRSKNAFDSSTIATTNTLPVKLIEFVKGPDSAVGDTYTDVIVMFNVGHQLLNTTGI